MYVRLQLQEKDGSCEQVLDVRNTVYDTYIDGSDIESLNTLKSVLLIATVTFGKYVSL